LQARETAFYQDAETLQVRAHLQATANATAQMHDHGQHSAAATAPKEPDTELSSGEVMKIDPLLAN
jgi:hypothetical protein